MLETKYIQLDSTIVLRKWSSRQVAMMGGYLWGEEQGWNMFRGQLQSWSCRASGEMGGCSQSLQFAVGVFKVE